MLVENKKTKMDGEAEETRRRRSKDAKDQVLAGDKSKNSLVDNIKEPARKLKMFQEQVGDAVEKTESQIKQSREQGKLAARNSGDAAGMVFNSVKEKVKKAQKKIGMFGG